MASLSYTTKLKLLIPVAYFVAANVLFALLIDKANLGHQVPGIVVADVAFVFWIIARVQLGNAFSLAPKSKFLVKSGLYRKLRHPVYYFAILAVIGLSIFVGSIYLLPVILILVLLEIYRIQKEEAVLTKTFGKEYTKYKQQSWF